MTSSYSSLVYSNDDIKSTPFNSREITSSNSSLIHSNDILQYSPDDVIKFKSHPLRMIPLNSGLIHPKTSSNCSLIPSNEAKFVSNPLK